jgi:predicted acyl esterase
MASQTGPGFAARGYRYVLQASRGTDGSGGTHSYFAEAGDGRATADWIAERSWFDGRLGSYGASYMGFTQWALASTKPPHLKAMAVALSTSVRSFSRHPGDSLALEVIIPWDLGAVQFNRLAIADVASDVTPEVIERAPTIRSERIIVPTIDEQVAEVQRRRVARVGRAGAAAHRCRRPSRRHDRRLQHHRRSPHVRDPPADGAS